MTTEEKAQAYDEAKARISIAYNNNRCTIGFINEIFPELIESKDERIRKALIRYFTLSDEHAYNEACGVSYKDIVAWLEKQEGKKTIIIPRFSIGDEIKNGNEESLTITKIDEKGYWSGDLFICDFNESVEWNLVGKVCQPKFHEGEWITNGDYTWKIVEAKPLDYILQSQDGNIVDDTISHVDEQFHSFTIKDAKDGDVLYMNNGLSDCVFIYKSSNNAIIYKHASYNKFGFEGEHYLVLNDGYVCLATKEQRDALMKAMSDAGYTFDFEKKELKKIESYILRSIIKDEPSPAIKKVVDSLITWSEEDEEIARALNDYVKNLDTLFSKINIGGKDILSKEFREKVQDWLKSLKDRVQPKQEWSEEDEDMIRYIGNAITCKESAKYLEEKGVDMIKAHRWLESFRSKNNITDEEFAQTKKNAYNNALDKIEYHSGEPTFDDGWSAAIDYIRKKFLI